MSELHSRRSILRQLTAVAVCGSTSAAVASDRKKLKIERVEIPVPGLPPALDGFRIGQISDLHLEPFTTQKDIFEAVQTLNSLKTDLVTVTGDFVTNNTKAAGLVADTVSHLEAPHGVFASLGNHDFWSGADDVVRALKQSKIPVLSNETRRIGTDKGTLWLGGIDSVYITKPDVRKTLQHWKQTQPLVLMMHEPDAADDISAAGVKALQLSGHTHGGQLVFGKRSPSPIRRARHGKKYLAGHYKVGDLELYVNRGIGCVGLPLRIGAPPEVTEITLRSPEVLKARA